MQAGSGGFFQVEDQMCSGLLGDRLRGKSRNYDNEKEMLKKLVSKNYSWMPEEDVELISDFNSSSIVPVMKDDFIIDGS